VFEIYNYKTAALYIAMGSTQANLETVPSPTHSPKTGDEASWMMIFGALGSGSLSLSLNPASFSLLHTCVSVLPVSSMHVHAYDIVFLSFLLPCVSAFIPGVKPPAARETVARNAFESPKRVFREEYVDQG
jgi:hypothetical protein